MSTATSPSAAPARTTEGCRYCWMCRQSCPVGHVTARETYTPHAWALVIESVRREQLTWNREAAEVMFACADCGLCQAHCVTDQPLPDAINRTRVELAAAGVAPPAVYELQRRLDSTGTAYSGTSRPAPVRAATRLLFVGDAAAHVGQTSVAAAERLLGKAGIEALAFGHGRSSGLLASTLGLRPTAVRLAEAVVADVRASGATEVLVLAPGDRWTFEHVYPNRLGVAWPDGVRVREAIDVLAEAHENGAFRLRPRQTGLYAYHDPCQTPRVDSARRGARALLAATLGAADARQLLFREHRAHPCGVTGGLEFTHPELASRLANARIADAHAAGAKVLITDDPQCLHQLSSHRGPGLDVVGLFELLAEACV